MFEKVTSLSYSCLLTTPSRLVSRASKLAVALVGSSCAALAANGMDPRTNSTKQARRMGVVMTGSRARKALFHATTVGRQSGHLHGKRAAPVDGVITPARDLHIPQL